MNARTLVWLAVLVLASPLVAPEPASADRLPTKIQGQVTLENDPWRPDTKDPGRALADRAETGLAETERPAQRTPIQRETWYRLLLRALKIRAVWGIWR